ncbi:MAG: von Willebrand factor type A domain-containing protein [Acidobacteria bacterium]|nr:von Willebrand factor type A domain-containing protein [Acidobacteriota bacterium]
MSDREERLVEALRKGPRPSPPDGLKQAIKDEIPATISPRGSTSIAQSQVWLIAAALFLMFGGGWLAFRLISSDSRVRSTVADHAPSAAVEDPLLQAPARAEKAEGSTDAEPLVDSDLKEIGTAIAEADRPVDQTRVADQYPAEPAAPSAPPPPALASASPVVEQAEKPSRDLAEDSTVEGRRETRQLAGMDSEREGFAAAEEAGRSSMKSRSANADVREPAILTEELALTETSSRMAVGDRTDTTLSYGQISDSILDGRLPDPDSINVQSLINHFDYGDRSPWRREHFSLFVEGGAAPFRHDPWRTIRIGIRGGDDMETSGDEVQLEVWFNPATVARYRRLGDATLRKPRGGAALRYDLDEITSDYARSWLFEVRLLPDIDPDEPVATANLRYSAPSGEQRKVERTLRAGHITSAWSATSSALKTAIVVGKWAESMKRATSMEESLELLQRTRDLESSPQTDEAVDELVRLIDRTVKLMTRP